MKILFVDPHESSVFSFRKELIDKLVDDGHKIILCTQSTNKIINEFSNRVYKIIDVKLDLKDKGILSNLNLKRTYKKIIKSEKPDLIISYKIKPNIYCGLYSKKIPMIANITGLGNAFKSNNLLSMISIFLYKKSFKNVDYGFFQNQDGLHFFRSNKIPINKYRIIPGSGVNVDKFIPTPIDTNADTVNFLFASRALKDKGFDLLIDAIPAVINKTKKVHFNFLSAEEDVFSNSSARNVFHNFKDFVTVLDRTDDMNLVYSQNDFTISPSFYREGISNVLLESLACGRPIITTKDNPGCMEVLQDNLNGLGVISNDLNSLIDAILKASNLSKNKIKKMGLSGREFVCKAYDRTIVINHYLEVIKELGDRK